ncbi:MAG: conserved membrane protein of unknown function [Candidatus Thorarchaeota archaeon]|nr:MAG: conserved membrane protein of unknown function [Candidatus Thorarchaeota archaeon]
MKKRNTVMMLLLLSILVTGAIQVQSFATIGNTQESAVETSIPIIVPAAYDSDNITIDLQSPAENSVVSGSFNLTLNVTSDNGDLNFTLIVDGSIHPDLNKTSITTGLQNITVDTTVLNEGLLNFTLLFEENHTGVLERESLTAFYEVDNHGAPLVQILAPDTEDLITGLTDLMVNITTDYDDINVTVFVDGEILEEYNNTLVSGGTGNYTINGTAYENGDHNVTVKAVTAEGLTDSAYRIYTFLDHVRITFRNLANYETISGEAVIPVKVFTPYSDVTVSAYVDGDLIPDVSNITLPEGNSEITLDTTPYSEGEHNITLKAYDGFGHGWETTLILVVDNHGIPKIELLSPDQDIVVGYVAFTVHINSTWDSVNLSVYIDNEVVEGLANISIDLTENDGDYTFYIDTSLYSKWEHTLKIVVVTPEEITSEEEGTFGFANIRIEEVISLVALLAIAIAIPMSRKKSGQPLQPIILADVLFVAVVMGLFLLLGVTSIPVAIWHFNLASVWAVGLTLIGLNWVMPFISGEVEE